MRHVKKVYIRDGRSPLPKNETVSRVMSANRGKNTSPELIVFRYLRSRGVYHKKHYRYGRWTIDIALPKKKIAVFIDGDFWHGWRYVRWKHKLPSKFWRAKIEGNMARDKRRFATLRSNGWLIYRVWEHQLKGAKSNIVLAQIVKKLSARP